MILKLCGIAAVAAVSCAMLKRLGQKSIAVSVVGGIIILLLSAEALADITGFVKSSLDPLGFGEYGTVMIKSLGIALVAKVTSDICRQCGEELTAGIVETTAKIQMLILCLPIVISVLSSVKELLS